MNATAKRHAAIVVLLAAIAIGAALRGAFADGPELGAFPGSPAEFAFRMLRYVAVLALVTTLLLRFFSALADPVAKLSRRATKINWIVFASSAGLFSGCIGWKTEIVAALGRAGLTG